MVVTSTAQVVLSEDLVQTARERLNKHDGILFRQGLEWDMVAALRFLSTEVTEVGQGLPGTSWYFRWTTPDRVFANQPHPIRGGGVVNRGIRVGFDKKSVAAMATEVAAIRADNLSRHGSYQLERPDLEEHQRPLTEADNRDLESAREGEQTDAAATAAANRAAEDMASEGSPSITDQNVKVAKQRKADLKAEGAPEPNPAGDTHAPEGATGGEPLTDVENSA